MRFRPRYSLRLLLLAVAIACVWLAWARRIIDERQAVIRMIVSRHGVIDGRGSTEPYTNYEPLWSDRIDQIPKLWTWFGVKPVGDALIPTDEFTRAEVQRIEDAFPELGPLLPIE